MALPATKSDKSIPTIVTDLWALVVAYFKQETVDPLKELLRFVTFGVGGAVLLSIGFTLWVLAILRALEAETGRHLTGHLSWAPYGITIIVCVAIAAIMASRIKAGAAKKGARR